MREAESDYSLPAGEPALQFVRLAGLGYEEKMKKPTGSVQRFLHLEHWQSIALALVLVDTIAINSSYFLALWFRFDCRYTEIPKMYLMAWAQFTPAYTVFSILTFYALRLYNSVWRFASHREFVRVAAATFLTGTFHGVLITWLYHPMPVSYLILGPLIQMAFVCGIRFSYRFWLIIKGRLTKSSGKRIMLYGAGSAGQSILRDIEKSRELNDRVVCVMDDNPNKWGRYIDGVLVAGGRADVPAAVKKYKVDKIYVAIPSATAEQRREVLDVCKETGCELKNLPGTYQLILGTVKASALQQVSVEDLLGREPIQVDMEEIFRYLRGKTILVTGGGGSIGSELCRQIAGHAPRQLIIFEICENYAYAIQMELKDRYPELDLRVEIGSVRDSRCINYIFRRYHPDVVYHAAAHKHVPLMEDSPCEAIKNNAIGTYKTAYAAMMNGCDRFVLISTDKAVNPTNIMGASKRLCEMVIQSFAQKIREGRADELAPLHLHMMDGEIPAADAAETPDFRPHTEFVAVRFGNVLGSNGSVIPRFREQIARGGPITVTHPDITRFFMTIPEAVSLVLQAGLYARGGEIFVLDMGTPVKIDTLARNMIQLSGLRPDVDIKIEYIGLRPGEKLYEETLMAEEGMKKTANKMIYIGKPIAFDTDEFLEQLERLMRAAYEERRDIKRLVSEIVPTYQPSFDAEFDGPAPRLVFGGPETALQIS